MTNEEIIKKLQKISIDDIFSFWSSIPPSSNSRLDLKEDGFAIILDDDYIVFLYLFREMMFMRLSSPGLNQSGMISLLFQKKARELYEEVVDQLLAE